MKQVMLLEKWHMFKDLVSCSFRLLLFPCCFLFFVMLSTVVDYGLCDLFVNGFMSSC